MGYFLFHLRLLVGQNPDLNPDPNISSNGPFLLKANVEYCLKQGSCNIIANDLTGKDPGLPLSIIISTKKGSIEKPTN